MMPIMKMCFATFTIAYFLFFTYFSLVFDLLYGHGHKFGILAPAGKPGPPVLPKDGARPHGNRPGAKMAAASSKTFVAEFFGKFLLSFKYMILLRIQIISDSHADQIGYLFHFL